MSVKVHGEDRLRPRRDGGLDGGEVATQVKRARRPGAPGVALVPEFRPMAFFGGVRTKGRFSFCENIFFYLSLLQSLGAKIGGRPGNSFERMKPDGAAIGRQASEDSCPWPTRPAMWIGPRTGDGAANRDVSRLSYTGPAPALRTARMVRRSTVRPRPRLDSLVVRKSKVPKEVERWKMKSLAISLLVAAACFAQGKENIVRTGVVDAHAANWIPPTASFASPPSSPPAGSVYIFTDASAVGACSGGGSALATCRWSGSPGRPWVEAEAGPRGEVAARCR